MATIRLKREEAIALVKEARDKFVKSHHYATVIEEGEAILKKLKSVRSYEERLVSYHKKIAKGLADGSITVTASGSLKNAPVKPKVAGGETLDGKRSQSYYYCKDAEDVKESLERYKQDLVAATAPFDAQIRLFEISADDVVEVEQGNLNNLLSGRRYY